MRAPIVHAWTAALALLLAGPAALAGHFVYEGRLDDLGQPAQGRYDLKLSAYGDPKLGATLAAPITFEGVEVKDGRFRLDVELPLVTADEVWLEVAVRAAGEPEFSSIPGRSKAIAAPLIGACWSTTGDSGSNPATNFIGTTDDQAFVIRTRNARSLRIEPSSLLSGGVPITANVLAGSSGNNLFAGVRGATIAGGGILDSDPDFAGFQANQVSDAYGTVGGGAGNIAGNSAGSATDAEFATVGGGAVNQAQGPYSTVSGGLINAAPGPYSVVPGGSANCAGGEYSFAGGLRAKVRPAVTTSLGGCGGVPAGGPLGDRGTFVWADAQNVPFTSTGNNQFLVRADGGLMLNTNTLPSGNDDLVVKARPVTGDADVDLRLVTRNDRSVNLYVADSTGTLVILPQSLVGTSNRLSVGGGSGGSATLTHGGAWTNASSRRFKEGFAAIDPLEVLERLLDLPITTWRYVGSSEGLHLGPIAEDFEAAFGLAGDGESIATVDADGVAMAAIQGLNRKLETERDALKAENAELRARLERLEARLDEVVAGGR